MPDIFDIKDFEYLEKNNISIIKANYRALAYIADMNRYIIDNITACRVLFPLWINWDYIRELFIMPGGVKETAIRKEHQKYKCDINNYPFHAYINLSAGENGNILLHDGKFLSLLYASHGDQFIEIDKVSDAKAEIKNSLYNFIAAHESIAIVVDCENSILISCAPCSGI